MEVLNPRMKLLVRSCWVHNPAERPDTASIVKVRISLISDGPQFHNYSLHAFLKKDMGYHLDLSVTDAMKIGELGFRKYKLFLRKRAVITKSHWRFRYHHDLLGNDP